MQISIDCDTSISIFIKGFFIYVISLGLALQKYHSNSTSESKWCGNLVSSVENETISHVLGFFNFKEKIIINLENIILTWNISDIKTKKIP